MHLLCIIHLLVPVKTAVSDINGTLPVASPMSQVAVIYLLCIQKLLNFLECQLDIRIIIDIFEDIVQIEIREGHIDGEGDRQAEVALH